MIEKQLNKILGSCKDQYYKMVKDNTINGYLSEAGARAILDYAKIEDHTASQRNAILVLLYRECKKTKKYEKKINKELKKKNGI